MVVRNSVRFSESPLVMQISGLPRGIKVAIHAVERPGLFRALICSSAADTAL